MTYLGMTMPMAVWSTITWIKNPSESGKEVEIQRLTKKHIFLLIVSGIAVTTLFYMILAALKTQNIVFSTISVTTSFFAASLTMLRSSYYAMGYAANDIVLIVLWVLASISNPRYLSVTIIFGIFFFYDIFTHNNSPFHSTRKLGFNLLAHQPYSIKGFLLQDILFYDQ